MPRPAGMNELREQRALTGAPHEDRVLALLDALLALLRQEAEALRTQDEQALVGLLPRKSELLSQLERAAPVVKAKAHDAAPTDPAVQLASTLHEACTLVVRLNQINGMVIARALDGYRSSLALLRGVDPDQACYDARGNTSCTDDASAVAVSV